MSFPRYPEYKESGVEWLGQVPAHWDVVRLRRVVRMNPSKSEIASLDRDTVASFLPMEAVGEDGSLDLSRTRRIGDVETGYTYFRDGDVAFAKITPCFENGKGALMRGLEHGFGFGTTELTVVRAITGQSDPSFIDWLFRSPGFRNNGEASMYGAGGQKRVPDEFVREFQVALPPIDEQRCLGDFLDSETTRIDGLISEQEKLIALLKEKRQAVISHAVTKGLDPNVPMKDSGIEWIGEVPAHWTVMPIRYAARLESGHTPSRSRPEYWENCTVPWFTLADIWQFRSDVNEYATETKELISELGLANSAARLLPAGTVMLSRTASVGFSGIMAVPMATTQDFANWVCGERLTPEFLLYVFRAMKSEFRKLMYGSTHNTIYMPDIQMFRFACPSRKEQQVIVDWIRGLNGRLDELLREAEGAVDLLRERRLALISAAVTGKIDVRQYKAKEAA